MTLTHVYFAGATLLGLLWFIGGLRIIYRRRVTVLRYQREGLPAQSLGVFTVMAGGFVLNYGLFNFLAGTTSILKGLALIGLFVLLIQAAGYALGEVVHAATIHYRQWGEARQARRFSRAARSRRAGARRRPTR